MAHKIRVLLLAGGQSGEHEISLISARSVLKACQGTELDITPVVIGKQGHWLSLNESAGALESARPANPHALAQGGGPSQQRASSTAITATASNPSMLQGAGIAENYDVVFPLLHGPNGEDGTVQGLLQLADLPYVGAGVLASALCMDKAMAKEVFRAQGLPVGPYLAFTAPQWKADRARIVQKCHDMGGPWFVKPANMGSSVGISKAKNETQLIDACELALHYDRRIVIEKGLEGAREIEVGILGNDNPQASPVGEITYDAEFYDYTAKYSDGGAAMHIPADIPDAIAKTVQKLGIEVFQATDCAGLARVDFFYLPQSNQVLVNEINTIPGFTPTSMYTKLWEAAGVSYAELIRRLILLAIERHKEAHSR